MLQTHGRSVGRSDNVKTVYPPTNTLCGGYNNLNWNREENTETQHIFCYNSIYTDRDQKYFHNVIISIDFNVFSRLQENLLCYCWPIHSYAFGVI